MSKREENFRNFYGYESERDDNPFIEDMTKPKRDAFVGSLKVPVSTTVSQTRNEQPRQEQRQPLNTGKQNIPPRNLKNTTKTSNKNFRRNIKRAVTITALAALLATTGIVGNKIQENHMRGIYSHDIQSKIEEDMVKELKGNLSVDDLSFDGQNFNVSAKSHRPELYKVLSSTDLDELLNDYLKKPTDDKKETLQTKLQGREQELAEFNMNLILASLADNQGKKIDDIEIKAILNHYNEANGNAIMKGKDRYTGHTLYVESLSGFKHDGKHDFTQIPNELFDLISDAKFQVVAPDSSYFEYDKNSKLDRAIETYKLIKEEIKDKNFSTSNGKMHTEDVKHNTSTIEKEDDGRGF